MRTPSPPAPGTSAQELGPALPGQRRVGRGVGDMGAAGGGALGQGEGLEGQPGPPPKAVGREVGWLSHPLPRAPPARGASTPPGWAPTVARFGHHIWPSTGGCPPARSGHPYAPGPRCPPGATPASLSPPIPPSPEPPKRPVSPARPPAVSLSPGPCAAQLSPAAPGYTDPAPRWPYKYVSSLSRELRLSLDWW